MVAIGAMGLLAGVIWLCIAFWRKKHKRWPLILMAAGLVLLVAGAINSKPTYADVEMKQTQIDQIDKLTSAEWGAAKAVQDGDKSEFARETANLATAYKKLTGKEFNRKTQLIDLADHQYNKDAATVKNALGRGVFVWVHADVARKITGKTSGKDYNNIIDRMYKDYYK